jgi:hypothetical protein
MKSPPLYECFYNLQDEDIPKWFVDDINGFSEDKILRELDVYECSKVSSGDRS